MIAKLLGATIVIFACGKIGFDFAARLARRVNEIRGSITALVALKGEMTFKGIPLGDALIHAGEAAENGTTDNIHKIFKSAGTALNLKLGMTAQEVWQTVLDNDFDRAGRFRDIPSVTGLSIGEKDLEILRSLGPLLGKSDIENQLGNIMLVMKKLEIAEKEAIEEERKYGKLYKSAGLLIGALIAILFI